MERCYYIGPDGTWIEEKKQYEKEEDMDQDIIYNYLNLDANIPLR